MTAALSTAPQPRPALTRFRIPIFSTGLWRQPGWQALLGAPPTVAWWPLGAGQVWLGWGRKRSGWLAGWYARLSGGSALQLEDGFLRSFGTGPRFAPLAIVVDPVGIYYDSTRPSALEQLLASDADLLAGIVDDVARARRLLLEHRLSKYNHAPDWSGPPPGPGRHVLVIDQTAGDRSVALGGADAATFTAMLQAARDENPGATVWVKTHPEVSAGRKSGYLTTVRDDAGTVVLRQAVNPLSLIAHMDHVYTVSSTMGFEALLAGKPVSCFGMPWYAGWGATDDRQTCPRRRRTRSVDELFAAGYFHYTRYLDPRSHTRGTIFDVIDWLVRQRAAATRWPSHDEVALQRMICIGYRRWKQHNLTPLLALERSRVHFVADAAAARRLQPGAGDGLVVWGANVSADVQALADEVGAPVWRMEDGFLRSVGLGSDLIAPLSLVLDRRGIYFDPSRASDLEHLLLTGSFDAAELQRAAALRRSIVEHGLTKYNLEPRAPAPWRQGGRFVVLVPGQVEDDASIRLGCTDVKTNVDLLRAARTARPDAFVVYKPHPDVMSGNRIGRLALAQAQLYADHIETRLSVVSCIDGCDEVHTMTSLSGFDALIRAKKVVTYGQPFYAGWGLTSDRVVQGQALMRRTRTLTLDELVAGTLLRYPLYWDWRLNGYADCESVLIQLIESRTARETAGSLEGLRIGYVRRQCRKLKLLASAWALTR